MATRRRTRIICQRMAARFNRCPPQSWEPPETRQYDPNEFAAYRRRLEDSHRSSQYLEPPRRTSSDHRTYSNQNPQPIRWAIHQHRDYSEQTPQEDPWTSGNSRYRSSVLPRQPTGVSTVTNDEFAEPCPICNNVQPRVELKWNAGYCLSEYFLGDQKRICRRDFADFFQREFDEAFARGVWRPDNHYVTCYNCDLAWEPLSLEQFRGICSPVVKGCGADNYDNRLLCALAEARFNEWIASGRIDRRPTPLDPNIPHLWDDSYT
ncbi:hypothetical protein B0J14DRAFT_689576 [Halenospora varia]|nr:hypothetical protein B0J14DRAFT_689576 [Halenospora varia]